MKMKRGIIIIRLIQKKKNLIKKIITTWDSHYGVFSNQACLWRMHLPYCETRFFLPHYLHVVSNNNPESQNFKQKAAGLLLAARYMRFPLIGLNFIQSF